jgi:hypothetical protein
LPISAKYRGADIAHFGNIRGSNDFERHEIAIILGRDEPTVAAAEQRGMAIWYDTKEPIRRVRPDFRGRFNYPTRTRHYLFRDGTTQIGLGVTSRQQPVFRLSYAGHENGPAENSTARGAPLRATRMRKQARKCCYEPSNERKRYQRCPYPCGPVFGAHPR